MSDAVDGVEIIRRERERQIRDEGWTSQHDDRHPGGKLAIAGAVYALPEPFRFRTSGDGEDSPDLWPFDYAYWKPTPNDRIRELAKAGALIAAEIDRLLRLKAREDSDITKWPAWWRLKGSGGPEAGVPECRTLDGRNVEVSMIDRSKMVSGPVWLETKLLTPADVDNNPRYERCDSHRQKLKGQSDE